MVFRWLRLRRRASARHAGVPADWVAHLAALPFASGLTADETRRLVEYARAFEDATAFEGCGGLELSEAVVRSIALQACRLILNLDQDHYSKVRSVLVYPRAFRFTGELTGGAADGLDVSGLAVPDGPVLLSWEHVRVGARDARDGRNVVYHEFAHKLDMLDGITDGTPALTTETEFHAWRRTIAVEYGRLRRAADRGAQTLIHHYGTQDPGEFFAEATEVFFERPRELLKKRRKLYRILRRFYRQDPARARGRT